MKESKEAFSVVMMPKMFLKWQVSYKEKANHWEKPWELFSLLWSIPVSTLWVSP